MSMMTVKYMSMLLSLVVTVSLAIVPMESVSLMLIFGCLPVARVSIRI